MNGDKPNKKWSRVEEADDILEQCFEALNRVPVRELRTSAWVPSDELLDYITETKDRVYRYMMRNHGWSNGH